MGKKATMSGKAMTVAFLSANIITSVISKGIKMIADNMDSAISRLDTLNNYTGVMSNLGVSTDDAEASMKRLSDALVGLPTTLNDAVNSVQRLTSANGNVKASTEMYLALNNAILAGGASMEIQSSAMEQLSQAYAKGKPDMMEWRTAMTAMPAQLNQVAKAMNYASSTELGEALRNGNVSMNEFMITLTKLNQEGLNGFQSFEEQARNATGGVATSIANVKTAITRGLTEIMNTIGQSNISGFFTNIANTINAVIPYITAFVKVCSMAVSYVSKIFGGTTNAVTKTSNNASNSLNSLGNAGTSASKGIDNATGSAKKLKKELQGLAGFDDMTVLSQKTSDNQGGTTGSSSGVGGVGALNGIDLSEFNKEANTTSNKVDEIVQKMLNVLKPLSKIDLIPLKKSFDKLKEAIKPVVEIIGNGLKKVFNKVIVPIAKFTIEKALPTFFNLLSSAIKLLTPILKSFMKSGEWLLETFLIPIANFTGTIFINAIKGITTVIGGLANKINSSKTAQVILDGITRSLLTLVTAWGVVKGSLLVGSAIQGIIAGFQAMQLQVSLAKLELVALGTVSTATTAGLTTMELVVGLLTGQLTLHEVATALATKAQIAFNTVLSANPIGVVIAAVALLTAGLIALANAISQGTKEEKAQAEAMKEKADAAEEVNTKYKEMQEQQQATIDSGLSEMTHIQSLADELRTLADEQGNVANEDRARAEFILGELNNALGTEYKMVGTQIERYGELSKTIDEQIEKKRLQILFEARETEYREALTKIIDTQKKKEQAKLELDKAIEDFENRRTKANGERVIEAQRQYDELNEAHKNMSNDIQKYEEAMTANLEGNTEKAKYILQNKAKYFETFENTVEKGAEEQTRILKEQQDKAIKNFLNYSEQFKKGNAEFTQAGLEEAQEYATKAIREYEKVGKNMVRGVTNGITNNQYSANRAINNLATGMENTFTSELEIHSPSRVFYGYGRNINDGIVNGLSSNSNKTKTTIGSIASGLLNKFKNVLGIHSPSKIFKQMGEFIDEGLSDGIDENSDLAINSINRLAKDISMADISPTLDLDGLNYKRNINITDNVSNQNMEILDVLKDIADKEVTNVVNVSIGEETIINKIINGIKAKNFETNGEVFSV